MASYLVTGVNRGIGISSDTDNVVIGTVRNKASMEKKLIDELANRPNIHIVEVEMTIYQEKKIDTPKMNSVDIVSKITGGKLDYIIANAGYISDSSAYDPIGKLGDSPKELEEDLLHCFKVNVVGNIHLFNLYMPLVLKGNVKKAITLSSGMADIDLINQYRLDVAAPYSISKGAMNIAVSKFHAQYAGDGVLFMGICPGMVETGHNDNLSQQQLEGAMRTAAIFNEYAPGTKPRAPEDSVGDVMKVIYESSLENGRGGAYISHLGNKRWL
ncbi:putative oxidoreductase [Colletotrichum spaethianum]|uniref:Oxidoreductase n=1 Tax=Colletotrichum spaethianum TaxID=700344 RepID=A0AA37P030_9PEZI|nr:putative oxidoreductase [Colletotrichum spaethianum]GKT43013.1 putative oxidoreductase [Colletotrichum spaethianum]